MFDLIKKKIGSFISSLTKKEEGKTEVIKKEEAEKPGVQPPSTKPVQPLEKKEREFAPKLGLASQIKSFFSNEVTITEGDAAPLFDELETAFLESDVSFDTTQFLLSSLKQRIVGKKVLKNNISQEIKNEVNLALSELFPSSFDLFQRINEVNSRNEPFIILFVGPNGMGKTTTISKLAHMLQHKGFSVVISASDVFRAAAIEQISEHGKKLGVRVIKHQYGSDPTAVAFDAIAHAKATKANVVLVDTAGRQETSYNLIKEMQKMNRVLKPHLKIFVGEAIAGSALVEQAKKFNEAIGVDALILTKLDCDVKGGSALSVVHETKLPILFIGVGQKYEDLIVFDAKWLASSIVS